VDGKRVEVTIFEVACSNGMGYLLASLGTEKPMVMSCFAADATMRRALQRAKSRIFTAS